MKETKLVNNRNSRLDTKPSFLNDDKDTTVARNSLMVGSSNLIKNMDLKLQVSNVSEAQNA